MNQTSRGTRVWWILRCAAAMCFIGHGAFGILTKAEWLPFFGVVGIGSDAAYALMPVIGAIDITLGIAALVRPRPVVFLYMAVWAFWTAALRPLSGGSVFELVERAGNYGIPAAALVLLWPLRSWRDWFASPILPSVTPERAARIGSVLAWTTALLLVGHGALALQGKELLTRQVEAIGLPGGSVAVMGWVDIAIAILVLARPRPGILVTAMAWKIVTELMYPITGAPMWEFIERGGSYGAPLALAVLVSARAARGVASRVASIPARLAALALVATMIVPSHAQVPGADRSLIDSLRRGGYVLAFRHGITDHNTSDNGATRDVQRNLTDAGVEQAKAIGAAFRALGIPVSEFRANPMYRNRETAEHAFGHVTVDSTLAGRGAVEALRAMLRAAVPDGTNRVIVTRIGILTGAFEGHNVKQIEEGDCIVAQPQADGSFRVVAHLKAVDWTKLASGG